MEIKPQIGIEDFAKIDLRVATILEAEHHPNADRMLRLQIDVGGEKRQICAGIRAFYEPETLVGKQIIVVANLKPAKLRGEISEGMLLAASDLDEEGQLKNVVLLQPGTGVQSGSTVG